MGHVAQCETESLPKQNPLNWMHRKCGGSSNCFSVLILSHGTAQALMQMISLILLNAASAVNFFVTSRLPYEKVIAKTSFSIIKIWALKTEENL